MATVEIEVGLRRKNQLTLPEPMARRLGVGPGDRLVFALDESNPWRVEVRPLRRSYAGIWDGIGLDTEEEAAAYIEGERASWGP